MAVSVYEATSEFPKREMYGLVSQLRRSTVSVPSNIAEGYGRRSTGDYRRFLQVAMGSICELETQLILAEKLKFLLPSQHSELSRDTDEVERMLSSLISKIN